MRLLKVKNIYFSPLSHFLLTVSIIFRLHVCRVEWFLWKKQPLGKLDTVITQFLNFTLKGCFLTLIHVAKCPKGLSCFEKQTAKHFLKWKEVQNLGIPGKLYKDYFHFANNLLKMPFSICFSTFCELIQKVRTRAGFLKEATCCEGLQ